MMNNEYYKYLQQLQAQALQQEAAAQATPAMPGDPNFRGPMSPPIEEIEVTAQKRQPGFFPSRIGRSMARGGGFQMTDAQKRGVYTPAEQAQFRADRNQGIGKMLLGLSDAFAGRPIAENFMAREEYAKQQEMRNKKLAEQQRIREAIMNDPNIPESMKELFANDTNLYGEYSLQQMQQEAELKKQEQERAKRIEAMRATNVPLDQIILTESGVPQSIIDDLIDKQNAKKERIIESLEGSQTELKASAERASKISGLQSQGFSRIEAASIIDDDLSASDITKIREERNRPDLLKTTDQLDSEVYETKGMVSEGLKNLHEAFGVQDFIQTGLAKGLGPIQPFQIAPKTTEANAARSVLNERVREKFLSEYSGRPSVYLNTRIDMLLPQGSYMTELEAKQKYSEVRRVLNQGLAEMKSKLDSSYYQGNELLEVQEQYKDIQSIIKDLDVGINALDTGGKYDSFYES